MNRVDSKVPALRLTVNGEARVFAVSLSVESLLGEIGLEPRKVAVERNLEIVPKSLYAETLLRDGDRLEIVHFIGGGAPGEAPATADPFEVAGRRFRSRLLVGTGKYKDFEETARAIEASGAEIVTVAVRRVNVSDPHQPMLVDYVDPKIYTYLPNTAAVTTPPTRYAPSGWPAKRVAGTWSSLRCWATRKPFIPTWWKPWPPPRC